MDLDLPARAYHLTLKWMELNNGGKNLSPAEFAQKYLNAHQEIIRVLSDNDLPETIDASTYFT